MYIMYKCDMIYITILLFTPLLTFYLHTCSLLSIGGTCAAFPLLLSVLTFYHFLLFTCTPALSSL